MWYVLQIYGKSYDFATVHPCQDSLLLRDSNGVEFKRKPYVAKFSTYLEQH